MNSNTITKRRRRRRGENNVDEKWSKHLPDELVENMVKRLGLFGFRSCTSLCSSWSSISTTLRKTHTFENQFPCIIRSVPCDLNSYSLYSPAENRATKKLSFPNEEDHAHRDGMVTYSSGCYASWLIIAQHSKNPATTTSSRSFLFDPVSGARIALPIMTDQRFFIREGRENRSRVFIKTVASSSPMDPNCIVAAVALHGCNVAFCKPNENASWTLQCSPLRIGRGFADLHFHEGKLYATMERKLDVVVMFDPIRVLSQGFDDYVGNTLSVSANLRRDVIIQWSNVYDACFSLITSSSGELLLVVKGEEINSEVFLMVCRCEFTMDIITNDIIGLKYEMVSNIGEEAIFVSNVGGEKSLMAMAKRTDSMAVVDELGGHASGNCIYITNEKDDRIGVYNIGDKTLKYYLSYGLTSKRRSKMWFTPELSMKAQDR